MFTGLGTLVVRTVVTAVVREVAVEGYSAVHGLVRNTYRTHVSHRPGAVV